MTTVAPASTGSDFAGLRRRVHALGLLDRSFTRYLSRVVLTLGFFAAVWAVLTWIGASWFALIPAAALGVASTQVAFLGHDGGHQQVSTNRTANMVVGLIAGNVLAGLSIGWWIDKHNRHHANPNKEDHDPDIGEGVLAFTTTHAAHRTGRVARAITRNQAVLFFPMLTLESLSMHVASVRFLRRERAARLRRTELFLLAVHTVGYLGTLLLVLSPLQALAFIGVHQAVFGFYMGCSFAPNHKGMPIIGADTKLDYLRKQVLTSRNVRGGWWVDQLLGGLNYQIEHHLFPSMPRANLRHARKLVRAYCAEHHIAYTETTLLDSYTIALRYLHSLGRPLRLARIAAAKP